MFPAMNTINLRCRHVPCAIFARNIMDFEKSVLEIDFSNDAVYILNDHMIYDIQVVPAAAHLSIIVRHIRSLIGKKEISIRDVQFLEPGIVEDETVISYRCSNSEFNGENSRHLIVKGKFSPGVESNIQFSGHEFLTAEAAKVEELVSPGVSRGTSFCWIRSIASKHRL